MRALFEEAFRVGPPLVMVAAVVVGFSAIAKREAFLARIRRARMLAVTGPLIDEESPTSNAARRFIWNAKRDGKWPTFRVHRA